MTSIAGSRDLETTAARLLVAVALLPTHNARADALDGLGVVAGSPSARMGLARSDQPRLATV
jgi:hypothetical protein